MAIDVDVQLIREILGPSGRAWTDDQLRSPAVVVPARRQIDSWCPELADTVDPDVVELATVALANLIAAGLIQSAPRVTSSRLGDSAVSFSEGSDAGRSRWLVSQARDLIADVCPLAKPKRTPVVWRVAPGGRAR